MELSIKEIADACKGKILGDNTENIIISSLSIDTRAVERGALFVPLKGKRVDGHDFINEAVRQGAVCALTERDENPESYGVPLIQVESAREALMNFASFYLKNHNVKIIGITGSAGKTSTKDMIYALLSQKYKARKTIGNYNNDIGMPLSISKLEPEDEVLVLEMGMNHAGEITRLSSLAKPDVAVITNIGDAHIENFGSRVGILHAKLEILDGLKQGGTVILNGDDPLLTGETATVKAKGFKVIYPKADSIISTQAIGNTQTKCHFKYLDEDIHVTIPVPGMNMVMNALVAIAVAKEFGLTPDEIINGFNTFVPPQGRLTFIPMGEITIISDVYNASPAAMMEAIRILSLGEKDKGRRVAVFGDMAELGDITEQRQREVGIFAAESGIDLLVAIGPRSSFTYEEFIKVNPNAMHFNKASEFLDCWRDIIKPDDTVLIKASRGMAFENVVERITDDIKNNR